MHSHAPKQIWFASRRAGEPGSETPDNVAAIEGADGFRLHFITGADYRPGQH
jgi:hypothetical protein